MTLLRALWRSLRAGILGMSPVGYLYLPSDYTDQQEEQ